jgi:hypothetical protein
MAMAAPRHISNPFATRHVRPGQLRPLSAAASEQDMPAVVATIQAAGGSAAIVGPHGTGKSTLLRALAAEFAAAGHLAGLIQLRRGRDGWAALRLLAAAASGTTACLDGWEQFGPVGRLSARLLARLRGCHLVVTSHRPTSLPLHLSTSTSLALLEAIVAALPDHGGLIERTDLAHAFDRHGGNLRESLADLYDRFELRARQSFRS